MKRDRSAAAEPAAGVVTPRLTAALSPENVGHEVTRAMGVHGDELRLTLQTNAVDGTPVERRLTWRRVG